LITTIKNSNLTAQINLLGAELCSLENNHSIEYIWDAHPDFWGKRSPILFPIVGTLKNNSYQYDGKEYHLSRHGFARDMVFELIDKAENSATFSIQSSDNTKNKYPFDFELQINYTLSDNSLFIGYKVINKSTSQMPFSIGAHPAFALPGYFEDYSIEFEKEEPLLYNLLENDLISNKTKTLDNVDNRVGLNYTLFENDALIFKTLKSNYLTLIKNEKPMLRMHYNDFPHLGIWTKKNASFLCVEPWFGYSDSVESTGDIMNKEGIQILEPKSIFDAQFSIEIL
jgi:galactose mutarotase-like enzyme